MDEVTSECEWTEQALIRETVSNIGSLEGVSSVEWVSQSPKSRTHELIRVTTRSGHVFRISVAYCTDKTAQESFDTEFPNPE